MSMVFQSIQIALEMLRRHKLRAFLTMLGVIIGVMSVTIIVMVSNGFQSYINGQFKKLGSDTIYVAFDPGRSRRGETTGGMEGLQTADIDWLMERVPVLELASAVGSVPSVPIRFEDRDLPNPRIMAVDENFRELNRFDLAEGRSFEKGDLEAKANVCLIGEETRDRLFVDRQALGRHVNVGGLVFEVVGVLKKDDFMGDSNARMVLIPFTTSRSKWLGRQPIDFLMVRPKPGSNVERAMDDVWQALMARSDNKPIFRIDSNESLMKVFEGVIGVTGIILAAIAALSLLVGGIGIMNIMLVSVTERTREIGLRKAVGARRNAILTQFVIEAGTLSLVGGLIGMGTAWMLGNLVTFITAAKEWPDAGGLATPFPISAALISAAFSAFIGMVFGLYPAMSAAKLDPIVALRHE